MENVLFILGVIIIGWFLLRRNGIKKYKKDITETCLHILKEPNASFVYVGINEYIDSLQTLKNANSSDAEKDRAVEQMEQILAALIVFDLRVKKYTDRDIEYIFHNDTIARFIGRWINVMLHNFEEEHGMIISNYYKRGDQ